jgi:capsule polysaccharide export protein KpsC/LpsZ
MAAKHHLPYVAFEDGFLRSVRPGNQEKPISLVFDRTGIYYDARQPSDLECFVRRRFEKSMRTQEIHDAIDLIRSKRLSKYNSFDFLDIAELNLQSSDRKDRVLVIDQTVGDASIPGAFAKDETFRQMLQTAVAENPEVEILIKVHPETMIGRKAGHFTQDVLQSLAKQDEVCALALKENRLRLTPEAINPWPLLEACSKVYCVSSQLGFEAILAGCEVHTFGVPFYGGWGLTVERNPTKLRRRYPVSLEAVFAALYFDYSHYLEHDPVRKISFEEAIDQLELRIKKIASGLRYCP